MDWSIKQGSKLKTLRMRKGFDQAYVANKLNISVTSISNWETGRNKPKPKHLHDIAFLYNVPIEEITEADVISVSPDSAIECYARSFPWQTLVEQHFLGDNKES